MSKIEIQYVRAPFLSNGTSKKRERNTKPAIRIIAMAVVVMMLLGILVMFTGCGTVDVTDNYMVNVPANFAVVCETTIMGWGTYIVAHVETGVLYLWDSGNYTSGMTVMLDADGTPLLYDEYVK